MNALSSFRPLKDPPLVKLRFAALAALTLLSACRHTGDLIDPKAGGGIYAVRSDCPIAGVPAGTGDITLFNPVDSTDSRAIDVTATITDVRATCTDTATEAVSTATFTIVALRRDPGPARQVVLPYFNVVLRGGAAVSAKSVGGAVLNFGAGDVHAWTRINATVRLNRSAAALPADVRRILTAERKPGEADAAADPLADPAIRTAVANATFEQLVGFQLTQDQLRYNATR
jgi:hypothetical protein